MGNRALRSLSVSYQKKQWWVGPRQSFFGYGTDYKFVLCCLHRLHSLVGVVPEAGRQSFFWYDDDKDLKARFPMTLLIRWRHFWHSGDKIFMRRDGWCFRRQGFLSSLIRLIEHYVHSNPIESTCLNLSDKPVWLLHFAGEYTNWQDHIKGSDWTRQVFAYLQSLNSGTPIGCSHPFLEVLLSKYLHILKAIPAIHEWAFNVTEGHILTRIQYDFPCD